VLRTPRLTSEESVSAIILILASWLELFFSDGFRWLTLEGGLVKPLITGR
jgi:hypothetical protein